MSKLATSFACAQVMISYIAIRKALLVRTMKIGILSTSLTLLENAMKNRILAVAVFAGVLSFGGAASAKGCLTGAAVGGVAGHVAGHHSLIGAGVGCAIGRHRANKRDRQAASQAQMQNQPTRNQSMNRNVTTTSTTR